MMAPITAPQLVLHSHPDTRSSDAPMNSSSVKCNLKENESTQVETEYLYELQTTIQI